MDDETRKEFTKVNKTLVDINLSLEKNLSCSLGGCQRGKLMAVKRKKKVKSEKEKFELHFKMMVDWALIIWEYKWVFVVMGTAWTFVTHQISTRLIIPYVNDIIDTAWTKSVAPYDSALLFLLDTDSTLEYQDSMGIHNDKIHDQRIDFIMDKLNIKY